MVIKSILVLSILFFISSCSSKDCEELVLDSVKYHDTAIWFGKKYYLYSRTTGWQEKVVFFELYEQEPVFNKCMHSNIKPIFARAFDDTEDHPYIEKIIFQPDDEEKLKIIYTKDTNKGIANVYDVTFTR